MTRGMARSGIAGLVLILATASSSMGQSAASPRGSTPADTATLHLPAGEMPLGTVRIPVRVMANGQPLAAGTYQLRLTAETAAPPDVAGARKELERWVEFLQGSTVKARAVASIVPGAAIAEVAEGRPPASGRQRVERLKGGDYLRVWINKDGDHVLLHLPVAEGQQRLEGHHD